MKTLYKRLLTFFIGFPIVLGLVFIQVCHHLPMHFLLLFFSVVGTLEFCKMAKNKQTIFPTWLIMIEVLVLWFACMMFCMFQSKYEFINFEYLLWIYAFEVIIFYAVESISAKTFEVSLSKMSISSMIVFYMGFLPTFIQRISTLPNESLLLILYFIFVFMCDSCAWFFGILFGKSTRGFVAASPNKSIVGFIGGIIGSIAFGLLFKLIFPNVITISYRNLVILGIITSLAAIIGDLIESVFKRSSGVKDSGNIIPGRGGVLDSIDSIVIAVPVFYICQYCFNLI